jgi:hypothetical protein
MQNLLPLLCDSREGGRGDEYMQTAEKGAERLKRALLGSFSEGASLRAGGMSIGYKK